MSKIRFPMVERIYIRYSPDDVLTYIDETDLPEGMTRQGMLDMIEYSLCDRLESEFSHDLFDDGEASGADVVHIEIREYTTRVEIDGLDADLDPRIGALDGDLRDAFAFTYSSYEQRDIEHRVREATYDRLIEIDERGHFGEYVYEEVQQALAYIEEQRTNPLDVAEVTLSR